MQSTDHGFASRIQASLGFNRARGDDVLSLNSPREPREPSAFLLFMGRFLRIYMTRAKGKDRTLEKALGATKDKWKSMSYYARSPHNLVAYPRMEAYKKDLKAYKNFHQKKDEKPDESPSEESLQVLSPFGVYVDTEYFFDKELAASMTIDEHRAKWESMTPHEKLPCIEMATNRMAEHERNTIAEYMGILEILISGDDDESDGEGDEGCEGAKAATGLLLFLEDFLKLYDEAATEAKPDEAKPKPD
ncbi:unnamed protein product [Thlaspi arvense]|uniref:HMG box domain-containing protein n=1 Tax=Thlaspi arvense TaxID=13288 RepID=A0AAU9R7I2_THLAR|nr:unnamed protein product [Thlaspi arvense]